MDHPYQCLANISSSGQGFEMAAVIDQLNFWDLHCFQFFLSLPINHMQLLHTVQEHNCAWVYPLQIKHTTKKKVRPILHHHSGQKESLAAQLNYMEDFIHLVIWWKQNQSKNYLMTVVARQYWIIVHNTVMSSDSVKMTHSI